MLPEDQFAKRTLKAGASGYITKDSLPDEILMAIRRVASGRKYVSQSLAEKLAADLDEHSEKNPHDILSDREFQILKLIASGKSQSEIANELTIGVSTVNTYRSRILEKLNIRNNADLIRYAFENKLVE
jgi:DNA-binding NarL/FixJ family response regulator